MRDDDVLSNDAMRLLIDSLGAFETERFLFLIKAKRFNYTEWKRSLWSDLTLEEVYNLAAEREKARER